MVNFTDTILFAADYLKYFEIPTKCSIEWRVCPSVEKLAFEEDHEEKTYQIDPSNFNLDDVFSGIRSNRCGAG